MNRAIATDLLTRIQGRVFLPHRMNPAVWERWHGVAEARLFVGLTKPAGRRGRIRGKLTPQRIRSIIAKLRERQLGTEGGGTVIPALGWWYDSKSGRRIREASVQVSVFPDEPAADFQHNVLDIAARLVEDLPQDEVLVQFRKDGRVRYVGAMKWRSRKRKG